MNFSKDFFKDITNYDKKNKIANELAKRLKDKDVVGVGSGSTSYLTLLALKEKASKENISFTAIPTSKEIEMVCQNLSIPFTNLLGKNPDWGFDGADEVDPELSLIKGRGGALFREKLVMASSEITYILVDDSKFVQQLGEKHYVPIEVYPEALNLVNEKLRAFHPTDIKLRLAKGKDGPIITENGNLILDAKFEKIDKSFEHDIKAIPGVIETGLFVGYNIEIIK